MSSTCCSLSTPRRAVEQIIDAEGETRRHPFEELVRLLSVHETAERTGDPLSRGEMPSGDEVIDARLAEEREAKQMLVDLCAWYRRPGVSDPVRRSSGSGAHHASGER